MGGKVGFARVAAASLVLLAALAVLTVRAVPATPFYDRYLPWIIARAGGIASLGLLSLLVALGIILSHPLNRGLWRQTKSILEWHRYLAIFTFSMIAVHVGAIILDRYAQVSLLGAFVPGLSGYRALAVALGTTALYALLLTAITASYAQRLPGRVWIWVHRFSLIAFALAWAHGLFAGSDSLAMHSYYLGVMIVVGLGAATRYWTEIPRLAPSVRRGESKG